MSKLQKLRNFVVDARAAREEAFKQGDWDLCDRIQLCVDDAEDDLARLELLERKAA